jgi:nicotinamide mononucleotide adenylyltransferase
MRMFELGADYAKFNTEFEVMGGYLSPVSAAYKKPGLASSRDRLRMCEIAANETSIWLMVDPWEAIQKEYVPTAKVLDHFDYEINTVLGGVEDTNGNKRQVRIVLLAGADLIQTMSTPGVWSEKDCKYISSAETDSGGAKSGIEVGSTLETCMDGYKLPNYVFQPLVGTLFTVKYIIANPHSFSGSDLGTLWGICC